MDAADIAKSLRIAQQLQYAALNAKSIDMDSADTPETAPEGHAVFTLYEMVEARHPRFSRPTSPPRGQWVTKVTVTSEWVSFEEEPAT